MSMRFFHRTTLSACKAGSFWQEKRDTVIILPQGFAKMLSCMSKQVKNTAAVSAFFNGQKCSVTSNKNYSATCTANKEKD